MARSSTTFAPVENNLSLHRWEVTDVPRMFDEPSMPPYEITLQRLLVSTTPDWRDVSKWYWYFSKPHLDATTPEMQKQVDELIASAKTDDGKNQSHLLSRRPENPLHGSHSGKGSSRF